MPQFFTSRTFSLFLLCALLLSGCRKKTSTSIQDAYTVVRGNLDITVLESGTLDTVVSNDIVQKIRQTAKILEIVDEGTTITAEDVQNGRVLVRFETKALEDQLYERSTAFENAQASSTQAEENLTIQISDNESSIRSAELAVLYAENDFKKLVGDIMAEALVKSDKPEDVASLLSDPTLGGQAKQDLTTLNSDIELANIRLNRSLQKLEYTKKLFDKQFVSKNELETDELEVETQKKTLVTAQGKLNIFCRYDFITNFHKAWATVVDSKEKLIRAKAVARSRLVSAEAHLRSQKQSLSRAQTRLDEAKEALDNCVIRATAPGLVVYETPPRWMNTGPIRPGVEIRHQQTIIKLPDLDQMAVQVNIHESQIDLIALGMPAVITVDAIPSKSFTGKVSKKALLPSSQNRWLAPDVKVYETMITFDQSDPNLRPGMNATVEVFAEKLTDVVYIPSQSVRTDAKGNQFCFSLDGRPMPIQTGKRNQSFVVVLSGVKPGDRVLMAPPELPDNNGETEQTETEELEKTLLQANGDEERSRKAAAEEQAKEQAKAKEDAAAAAAAAEQAKAQENAASATSDSDSASTTAADTTATQ